MKQSKRYREAEKLVDRDKIYTLKEAVGVLKKMPMAKFDESIELSCKLGVDPKQSDQVIRGSTVLPNGTGKTLKILVFCEPEKEAEAKKAGADFIGSQDMADKILKENWLDFEYCISTPGMMKVVSRLGKILGPRGLMPSPKTGSVTENISYAISEAKRGKIDFRMDKLGCIHLGLGKMSFSEEALIQNIQTFIDALIAAKPGTVKGEFLKTFYLSTTMSPSVKVAL